MSLWLWTDTRAAAWEGDPILVGMHEDPSCSADPSPPVFLRTFPEGERTLRGSTEFCTAPGSFWNESTGVLQTYKLFVFQGFESDILVSVN